MMQISNLLGSAASFIDSIPGVYVPTSDLENTITDLSLKTVTISAIALMVLTPLAMLFSGKYEKLKMPLFMLMVIAMAGSTITLIGATAYLNTNADSGGPVHWHADFEIWACNNELELRDPTGFLSNKIGTSTLHEHNDHRVHLEGVVVEDEVDASLGKFFHVIGGAVTDSSLVVPLNADGDGNLFEDEEDGDGPASVNPAQLEPYIIEDSELGKIASFTSGNTCGDEVSEVQVYVFSVNDDNTYQQTKITNPRDYVITGESNVPDGDCIIFEFGPSRDATDKLCEQYGVRDIERCEAFGVGPTQKAICELTEINNPDAEEVIVEDTARVPSAEETSLRNACIESVESLAEGMSTDTTECGAYRDHLLTIPEVIENLDGDSADLPNPADEVQGEL